MNKLNIVFIITMLACPVFADYVITVQNGDQALFLHPVSVELTSEQLAFVEAGALLTEDGSTAVEFAVDTTGTVPRLCWVLDGETGPGLQRVFHLSSSVPTPSCVGGSVPANFSARHYVLIEKFFDDFLSTKFINRVGDLECREQDDFITISNSYFQLRHPVRGDGGFPRDIQYRESGYKDPGIEFYDRLYHPDQGMLWAKSDHNATCKVVLDTPQRVVVEARTHFLSDLGAPAVGNPEAIYRYSYSAYSPVVEVERVITREDASQKWTEAHFLQICRRDRFYTTIYCGEPMTTATTNPDTAEPRGFSFSQWGIYAAAQGALGVGGTKGGGYDRGKHGFPYNLAAQNLGFPDGETERYQKALLYFGPAKTDEGWYSRWLGSARPTVTIHEVPAANTAEESQEISDIVLDCNGMRIYFASAEEGYGCLAVENLLGKDPVRFVFPRETPPLLWNLAFKKPYALRQQEASQPDFIETAWLNSLAPGQRPVLESGSSGELIFTWTGLDLPGEPGVVDVRCCVLAPKGARSEALWRIQVTNRSTQWGLAETHYPILTQVIHPGHGDALLPDSTWGHRLIRNSDIQSEQIYPGYKCPMQFMAFNQGKAGLYLAAHDPGARPKRLTVTNGQDASFRVFAENYAQPGAGNNDDFAFCLTAYQGDWWKAAKRYRQWATTETPWTAKGPIATRKDFPRSLVDASFWMQLTSGPRTDQLGTCMEELHARIGHRPGFALHWYRWHQIPFDNSYPEYFPVHDGFAANVLRLTSQGMLVMPYINARLWDVDIPSFNDDARNACALTEHGEPAIEIYESKRKLTPMCPFTKLWQDKVDEITTRLMDEYKVSGIYLDQIGCAPAELCFNPSHGHPLGGGTHWVDGYRTLLNRIKAKAAPKGVFLTSEASAEPYIDNIDGNLICTERFQEEVPTLAAVYSGYTIYFSCTNHPRDDLASFRAGQCRDFLWGCQPGWNCEWITDDAHREHFAYEAYLGHLQQAAKEFFREGELLGEAKPANNPDQITVTWHHKTPRPITLQATQGYWWKAPDGRLLLAVANLSSEVVRFELQQTSLRKLLGLNNPTAFLAERLTADGTAPLAFLEKGNDLFYYDFTLEPGEVCLVTFTPADKKTRKNAQKRAETIAFDEQANPELRNAAAEFLFHAKFNVSLRTQTTICELPGAPVEFSWWFSTTDAAGAAPYPKVPGKAPKGCTIVLPNGQEIPATLGGHAQAIRFADDASSPLTYCELRHGNLSWRIPVWRRTVNPVEVTLGEVPEVRAGKSFVLPVTIQNFQAVPANGAVRLNLPETWSVEPSHIIHYERLEYKRPKTVYVRVSVPEDVAPEMTFLTAEVIADRQSRSFAVQPSRPQIIARRAVQPIDVRNPANWPTDSAWTEVGESAPKSVKISDYRGNDDCSGRLRCAWDDQYLYVQAEVTDDVHVQKIAGEKLWGGDCIQLALCPGKANLTHGYNGREREIGLAFTEGGFAFAYQWMGGPRQGILDNVPVIVKREGNQTRYCVAIPWSTLLMSAPKSGEVMSFSFTFNDNDAGSLRGWLEWTPGVCGGKDSSLFGELRFAE